jgi:hypothetical protein
MLGPGDVDELVGAPRPVRALGGPLALAVDPSVLGHQVVPSRAADRAADRAARAVLPIDSAPTSTTRRARWPRTGSGGRAQAVRRSARTAVPEMGTSVSVARSSTVSSASKATAVTATTMAPSTRGVRRTGRASRRNGSPWIQCHQP